jgi:hypothetical protein
MAACCCAVGRAWRPRQPAVAARPAVVALALARRRRPRQREPGHRQRGHAGAGAGGGPGLGGGRCRGAVAACCGGAGGRLTALTASARASRHCAAGIAAPQCLPVLRWSSSTCSRSGNCCMALCCSWLGCAAAGVTDSHHCAEAQADQRGPSDATFKRCHVRPRGLFPPKATMSESKNGARIRRGYRPFLVGFTATRKRDHQGEAERGGDEQGGIEHVAVPVDSDSPRPSPVHAVWMPDWSTGRPSDFRGVIGTNLA